MIDRRYFQTMELNNHATKLLMVGNTNDAITTFARALHSLKYVATDEEEDTPNLSINLRLQPYHPKQNFGFQDESIFIFDRPFSMIEEPEGKLETHILAGALLFNCALAYHLRYKQTSCGLFLQQAKHLYHSCKMLLLDSSSDAAISLSIFATNNLCQVEYNGCCDYKMVGQLIMDISDLLHSVDQVSCLPYLSLYDYNGLQLNMMFLVRPPGTAGAA